MPLPDQSAVAHRALPPLTIYVRDDGSVVQAALSAFDGARPVTYVPYATPDEERR